MSVCRCCYFEVVAHRGLVVTSVQAIVWHNRCSTLLALTVTASSMTLFEHPESQEFNPFAEETLPGALDDPYYMNDEEEKLENEKKIRTKLAQIQHIDRYQAELRRQEKSMKAEAARRATFIAYDRAVTAAALAAALNPDEGNVIVISDDEPSPKRLKPSPLPG